MTQVEQPDHPPERAQGAATRKNDLLERRRNRETRRSVLVMDRVAAAGISVGGLFVIFAVVGIMFFLVKVTLPLMQGGEKYDHSAFTLVSPKQTLWLNADEYQTIGVQVSADGEYRVFHLATGTEIGSDRLDFGNLRATAVGGVVTRDEVAFGFENGSIRFAELRFDVDVLLADDLPKDAKAINARDYYLDGVVYSSIAGGQLRRVRLNASIQEPQQISDAEIVALSYRVGGTAERPSRTFVTFDSNGVGRLSRAESKVNIMTRKVRTTVSTSTLPSLPADTNITETAVTTLADAVYVASDRGDIFRFDTRNFDQPTLSETVKVFQDEAMITSMDFLVGEQALVVGGSNGELHVYFKLSPEEGAAADGYRLTRARSHEPHGAAISGISISQRSKALVTQAENGEVWVRHSTSDQVLLRYQRVAHGDNGSQLLLMPRVDGVLRVDHQGNTDFWSFKFPHPEATLNAIFGEVWYEGYSEPTYTWQSSSGTDVFEPKFSLVPLIFGTLKATFYALLFAVPIALMAAMYTSEFVHPRIRGSVKPMMEMMEALPTVVLGFIGALILAPIVETWISAVLLSFIALPMGLMLSAFLWQLLPLETVLKLEGIPKFTLIVAVIILSLYVAYLAGPAFEQALFYGDFKAWVNGDVGSGTGFMFLLLSPVTLLLLGWGFDRMFGDAFRVRQSGMSKTAAGAMDLGRWLALLLLALLASLAIAALLTAMGVDPRGGIVDTYVQRNALVVGFVMGFAIIPNIYTLAEDALNSVPNHVRSASLAAGATPWQTAKWVVLPTAMSGVFAACMIGMGRAVGETMIVLMAAGNTPVLEWNIFNGLRTLSANIAVELPEAVQDGTLYRMLFLAALTLFSMTFVINTIAEIIRQRFRRRAFQL